MEENLLKIQINNTSSMEIARVILSSTNFPKGSLIKRVSNVYYPKLSPYCVAGYYYSKLQKNKISIIPDFIIFQLLNKCGSHSNIYTIEYNEVTEYSLSRDIAESLTLYYHATKKADTRMIN